MVNSLLAKCVCCKASQQTGKKYESFAGQGKSKPIEMYHRPIIPCDPFFQGIKGEFHHRRRWFKTLSRISRDMPCNSGQVRYFTTDY